MKQLQTIVGQADVIADFLVEIAADTAQVTKLELVSPFVELANAGSRSSTRLRNILVAVHKAGGHAILVSEDTPRRRADFIEAATVFPALRPCLFLCPGLHAKIGFARTKLGVHFGFLGSANLTDAGLYKNREAVFGMRGKPTDGTDWQLVAQLQQRIARIRAQSLGISFDN